MTYRNIERYESNVFSFENVEDFIAAPIGPGLHTINYNGKPLDFLIDPVENAESVIISFHPAATDPATTRPYFLGRSLFASLPAHRVYFSDPSLEVNDSLTLAWFAGNRHQRDMQQIITTLIRHIVEKLNAKNTIMFGASGGGFAALYYSARTPKSLALVVNPQTDIMRYWEHHVLNYAQLAWGIGTAEKMNKTLPTETSTSVLQMYSQDLDNAVIYLQNTSDSHHVEEHFTPLLQVLNPTNNVRFFFGLDWGQGHKPAPKKLQVGILERAVACNGDWSQLLEVPDLQSLSASPQEETGSGSRPR